MQTALMIIIAIIVLIVLISGVMYYSKESFYIQSWKPQTFSDINSGAPLAIAYNNTVFDNNSCGWQLGLGYLL